MLCRRTREVLGIWRLPPLLVRRVLSHGPSTTRLIFPEKWLGGNPSLFLDGTPLSPVVHDRVCAAETVISAGVHPENFN